MAVHFIQSDPNPAEARMELLKHQIQNADSTQITDLIEHLESEWSLNKRVMHMFHSKLDFLNSVDQMNLM